MEAEFMALMTSAFLLGFFVISPVIAFILSIVFVIRKNAEIALA